MTCWIHLDAIADTDGQAGLGSKKHVLFGLFGTKGSPNAHPMLTCLPGVHPFHDGAGHSWDPDESDRSRRGIHQQNPVQQGERKDHPKVC